jgi:ABC-2 type transport system permease protein
MEVDKMENVQIARAAPKNSRLAAYARFLATAFAVNVKAVLEYRVNFILQFFGMMLNNAAFAAFWAVLISRTGAVGGYGFGDIMFVWGLVSTSFGLAHIVFGNIRGLSRIVIEGGLDVYLLQPKDVWLNLLASRTIVSAWGDFAYGFIILALLPGNGPLQWLLFLFLAIPAALVFVSIFALAESLCFFMGNSAAIASAVSEFLLTFSLYPEGVHASWYRWILYSLIPSAFVAFVPLRIFKAVDWPLVPLLWGLSLAYVALSWLVFQIGLKRYESGNRMDARI